MKRLFVVAVACALSLTGYNQDLNKAKLDSLFDVLGAKNKGMGSVALAKDGKVIYARAIGYSDAASKKPATPATKYRIGSITKMFTASMIFQLIEEGKLSLTSTLDKWFPQMPNAGQITINHLLSHHSGLHNFTDDSLYQTYMTQPKSHDQMIAIIAATPADFKPGEKASYSNSNYVLLGYIIEKITGKSYAQNLAERIIEKAGLKNTYVGSKINLGNNESSSYTYLNTWKPEPETDMSIPGGAGMIVSTPSDLVLFVDALFNGKIVSKSSLEQMRTIKDRYGLGMITMPFYDKKAYGHTGGIDGFSSVLGYFPADSLAVAYCSNGIIYPTNNILIGVLSIYYGKTFNIPTFESAVKLSAEELEKYTGVYASEALPIKITVTSDGTKLEAQATGQSSFPLDAIKQHVFQFEPAGIIMEFDPADKSFILHQGGGTFKFKKD